MSLQATDIANYFTADQIQTEITSIQSAISNARQSMSDSFGDTQASQTVKRQALDRLNNELAVYIRAYQIVSNNESASAELIAAKYNPSWPRI
jgi:hypothetical protein